MLSNSLRDSTFDFNLASSSANFSASLIIFSMSSGVSLFWSFVMVIFSLLPVPLSSAGTWGDVVEVELTELVVVFGHGPLSFKHLDGHRVLVVSGRGEHLGLLGWDNSVPGDEFGHDSSNCFNSHRQRVNVKQHNFPGFCISREDSGLHRRSVSDGFIRVDASAGLLAVKELLDELLDLGDPSGAANQHDLINIFLLHVGIIQNLLNWFEGSTEKIHVEFFKFGSGKRFREV